MVTRGKFEVRPVGGQELSNTIRRNIHALMRSKDMPLRAGLECMPFSTLYSYLGGKNDISITRLQDIAKELGVNPVMLMVRN